MTIEDKISNIIIGCAIEVHKTLGPGLLESAYEECLCFELTKKESNIRRQVPLPVVYKEVKLDCGYRIDIIVDECVIIELKTVEKILPIHEAQLLTYLKLTDKKLGVFATLRFYYLKKQRNKP